MDVLEQLLHKTVNDGASDLHLTVGAPPCYRLNGEMMPIGDRALDAMTIRELLTGALTGEQQNTFREQRDIDLSMEIEGLARFRVNMFVGRLGEGAVFRVIPTRIKSCQELGLPQVVADLARLPNGLVLVTGPTGSGKSTTLAALVDIINSERHDHILTIEDPIEFVHKHKSCIVNQREVKAHTESFASALRAALREDPDVILVGEMRDLETIALAISAAETGHLVLGTLHTSSAPQTVDRVIDVFPPHQQQQVRTMLSESLQAVVSQQLVSKIGGGRIAAHEIMLGITAVRNLIREGKTFQLPSVIETNNNMGMQTLEQALELLIKRGLITAEAAIAKGLDQSIANHAAKNADAPAQAARPKDAAPTPAPVASAPQPHSQQQSGSLSRLDDDEPLQPLGDPKRWAA
jgi:twitching motility protein PilT